ncbi:uncharacterized transporter slc-17.2-like isoform X1 [Haliotis rufescens]|uniref:uncharacterized transporter slc-17.2-like isoform X1 n=2 Tax=Haliotis rufescens TaxID=6454 RepID=UPI00201F8692|nr:uncharacterized transporter slc-17.2-like isoform X1 [Haliotis rufescens]
MAYISFSLTKTMPGTAVHESDDGSPPWYRSTRYFISFIGSFGMINTFLQRGDLSMAIVCMVNHTAVDILKYGQSVNGNVSIFINDTRGLDTGGNVNVSYMTFDRGDTSNVTDGEHSHHPCDSKTVNIQEREDGELVWDKETQGLVLGGLFWGYMTLQIFCSFIIQRWGSKKVVATGMFFMSILTLLTPVTAWWSPWAVLVLRAMIGVFNWFTINGIFALWGKWAPPTERSRLICITYSGTMSATALVFPLSALLCKVNFAGGWPTVFYFYGVIGICWTFIWIYSVYDDPAHHPRIHPKERRYIEAALGKSSRKGVSLQVPTPWRTIFTSLPFLGIVCAHVTYNWGLFLMMSNLPTYMMEVLRFDIQSNGVYSLIPYLAMLLAILLGSLCADTLIEKQLLSVNYTRKLMTIVGHFIPGLLLIVLSYLDCTQSHIVVALLTLIIGLGGLAYCGLFVNFYDIAPVFATKIMSVSNAISMMPGILAPYVVAEVTKDKTREQWQIVFFLTAGLLGLGTVVYLILGQGHVQKWAVIRDAPEEEIALPS